MLLIEDCIELLVVLNVLLCVGMRLIDCAVQCVLLHAILELQEGTVWCCRTAAKGLPCSRAAGQCSKLLLGEEFVLYDQFGLVDPFG